MFEDEGYFFDGLKEEQEANKKAFELEYKLAFEIMKMAYIAFYNNTISDIDKRTMTIWSLLCKLMDTYNSVLVLSTLGLESDARSLLRVMIEEAGIIGSLIKDKKFLKHYELRGDYDTYELFSTIRNRPNEYSEAAVKMAQDYDIEKLGKHLDDNKFNPKKVSLEACISRMKMEDLYYNAYPILCRDVHTNVKTIEFYWDCDETGKPKGLNPLPKYEDQRAILITAADIMLRVLRLIGKKYQLIKLEDLIHLSQGLMEIGEMDKGEL